MEYPRYTREQSLNCKLTDIDIKEIRRLRKLGFLLKEIAKIFKVNYPAIIYWLLSPEKRKERNHKQYLMKDKEEDRINKQERQRRSISRKRMLMPEYVKYDSNRLHQSKLKNET